jgi:hypothetical protein
MLLQTNKSMKILFLVVAVILAVYFCERSTAGEPNLGRERNLSIAQPIDLNDAKWSLNKGEQELSIAQPIDISDAKWSFIKEDFRANNFSLNGTEDLAILQVDLNDDGTLETFVYVNGLGGICGAHNCPIVAYHLVKNRQERILYVFSSNPFYLLSTTHNGFHDLSFLPTGYRRYIWQFNGMMYE